MAAVVRFSLPFFLHSSEDSSDVVNPPTPFLFLPYSGPILGCFRYLRSSCRALAARNNDPVLALSKRAQGARAAFLPADFVNAPGTALMFWVYMGVGVLEAEGRSGKR